MLRCAMRLAFSARFIPTYLNGRQGQTPLEHRAADWRFISISPFAQHTESPLFMRVFYFSIVFAVNLCQHCLSVIPENRQNTCLPTCPREKLGLLAAANTLVGDLLKQDRLPAAAVLGAKGGTQTAKRGILSPVGRKTQTRAGVVAQFEYGEGLLSIRRYVDCCCDESPTHSTAGDLPLVMMIRAFPLWR